jgi:hypothetical protein
MLLFQHPPFIRQFRCRMNDPCLSPGGDRWALMRRQAALMSRPRSRLVEVVIFSCTRRPSGCARSTRPLPKRPRQQSFQLV